MSAHVPAPDLTFRDGTPVSPAFDDVYFSRAGGVEETTHVFLRGNHLPERFAEKRDFTIAELGFGTGLNCLVAWDAFLRATPKTHHLHYLAIEKFPLTVDMLQQALALHPELHALSDQLIAAWPLRLPGLHRIHLPRITLTLSFGDVAELLPQLDARVDAWFLDGFAPAKNPAMWGEEVLSEISRLSASDASFATFTAAGFVKRGLAAQGFTVEKVQGYGHKREMLVGRKSGAASPSQKAESAIVIGGGIAGCALARTLAERGVQVTLLEREDIASGASGNRGAVLFPQLTKRWTESAAWYFAGYSFMLQQLRRWKSEFDFAAESPGMLRLPRHAEEEAQLTALNETLGLDTSIVHWNSREEASAKAGVELATGGAWFPQGTWLSPAELCRGLLRHPNINVLTETSAVSLLHEDDQWLVTTATGMQIAAQHCCVATAQDAVSLLPDFGLRLHAVGGQVSEVAGASQPRSILCQKGYAIPVGEHLLIGATYNRGDDSRDVTAENHAKNVAEAANFLPSVKNAKAVGGRTSFRATVPDRVPYVGKLAEGLWISAGHGSRGMLSAPLAAEVIASEMMGEQIPLTRALRKLVNPLRFKA